MYNLYSFEYLLRNGKNWKYTLEWRSTKSKWTLDPSNKYFTRNHVTQTVNYPRGADKLGSLITIWTGFNRKVNLARDKNRLSHSRFLRSILYNFFQKYRHFDRTFRSTWNSSECNWTKSIVPSLVIRMIDYSNVKWIQQNSIDQNEIQWLSELYEFVLSELAPITCELCIISIIGIEWTQCYMIRKAS